MKKKIAITVLGSALAAIIIMTIRAYGIDTVLIGILSAALIVWAIENI